jgi:hypothetical protein
VAKLVQWFVAAAGKIFDPNAAKRVENAAEVIRTRLAQQREDFNFAQCVQDLGLFAEERRQVAMAVYRSLYERAWRRNVLSENDQKTLQWASIRLELQEPDRERAETEACRQAFASVLAVVRTDGVVDTANLDRLDHIAVRTGMTSSTLVKSTFSAEAGEVLRRMFAHTIRDSSIDIAGWQTLIFTAERLGIDLPALQNVLRQPVEQFAESLLAEAKEDGRLSQSQKQTLQWLVQNICDRKRFIDYLNIELARLDAITTIREGRLPSLAVTHVGLKAGELVHFASTATYTKTYQSKSGARESSYRGRLLITDHRLLFSADAHGLDVHHRKVLEIHPARRGFKLNSAAGGSGHWLVDDDTGHVALIYDTAVRLANQSIVARNHEADRRRIPREVRQRVFQRDGGRCVECGSSSYLEFDHVIPVAKGGGNSDQNVQLLCRACNGKKSDRI